MMNPQQSATTDNKTETCRMRRCDHPPAPNGVWTDDDGREHRVRRGFCSVPCELRWEHLRDDARDARDAAEGRR
jgi:hypothetical protein